MTTKRLMQAAAALGVLAIAATGIAGDKDVVARMHENYGAVLKIQSAVIAGSLEETKEPATFLVESEPPPGLPEGAGEHYEAMRTAAGNVLAASNIADAATATSQLGVACGSCHAANEVTIEFAAAKQPSDKEKIMPHMQRHQWAADRMWEGLIGPSDYAWNRGGNMLFESPIRDAKYKGPDAEWRGMAIRIHQLAANATRVYEVEERAGIYAEFIANCAACHQAFGKGPKP